MAKCRILVVDDEPLNLEMIREFLIDEPYELALFEHSTTAWAYLSQHPDEFDAIVLDRLMPDMDGIEFLHRVKATPALADLPVVMQTAASAPEQIAQGLSEGAYYYLTKPYEPTLLISILRAALSTKAHAAKLNSVPPHGLAVISGLQDAHFVFRHVQEINPLADLLARLSNSPEHVAMGLRELFCNAIEHGNLKLSYQDKTQFKLDGTWDQELNRRACLPENVMKTVRVHLHRQGPQFLVTIEDDGPGFDWQPYLEISPDRAFDPNGRGIALSRKLCFTSLAYQGKGNMVRVSFLAASMTPGAPVTP